MSVRVKPGMMSMGCSSFSARDVWTEESVTTGGPAKTRRTKRRGAGCPRRLVPVRGASLWRGAGAGPRGPAAPRQRNKHRDLFSIAPVLVAKQPDQVALFQLDRDQDVAGGRQREQQVSGRHRRRRPEGEQEAEVDRMAHALVEQGVLKLGAGSGWPRRRATHLAQAEQLEMVDQEGAHQHQAPAEPEDAVEDQRRRRIVHDPHRRRRIGRHCQYSSEQRQAGEQHVGAALDRMRHEARPPALEARARHDAVLDGEQAEQQHVDRPAPATSGPAAPLSIVLGTGRLPTKPMA